MPGLRPTASQPVSTYRLQLRAEFGFDDAAAVLPYLADLGVTHVYCSPWFQAAPGSAHGYDVIDHAALNAELGGQEAFERFVAACTAQGLGIVLDIVPNHMAVGAPEWQNAAWWSLLAEGPHSPYASWFDVQWDAPDNPGRVVLPVLAGPLAQCLEDLVIEVANGEPRIRYHEHAFPIADGTLINGDIVATLARQHYRLCDWRVGPEELNYRRFFDVVALAGVRVEIPAVFEATHALALRQQHEGVVAGFRVDHPDGLADPAGYLETLAAHAGGCWVVVEKILQADESLPSTWNCAGTTGYDALNLVTGLFVDPAGQAPLTTLWRATGGQAAPFTVVARESKLQVLDELFSTEVTRLVDIGLRLCRRDTSLRDTTRRGLREAIVEVLASFAVYRAYVTGAADDAARAHLSAAVATAQRERPWRKRDIDTVGVLALGEGPRGPESDEFVLRFQQTCGPVMAKGVEDTAFYRYPPLLALNEVGGDPGGWGTSAQRFHQTCARMQRDWPLTMTTLSTHDTKRSEDVRARLAMLSQLPTEWGELVAGLTARAAGYTRGLDAVTQHLLWQTAVGAWPLPADRAAAYLLKAVREAKLRTSWLSPDGAYEDAVTDWVQALLADDVIVGQISRFCSRHEQVWRATALSQKLVQLTMPGVADTYQGCEHWDLSLVDPDNRRAVDYGLRRRLLAAPPTPESSKLHLVASALRLRRNHPDWFLDRASYQPLECGPRGLGFLRAGRVATVVPLRSVSVAAHGWTDESVVLPDGLWLEVLTGRRREGGRVALADLLAPFPVSLLVSAVPVGGMGPL